MNVFAEAKRLRNDPSPKMEKLQEFFAYRDRMVASTRAKIADYLELSPMPWPRRWSDRPKEN